LKKVNGVNTVFWQERYSTFSLSPHPANIQGMEKSVTRGFQQGVNRAKIPKFNRCRRRKSEDIVPLSAPSKQFLYRKEIITAVSLRLLPLEMLYEGKSSKNHK